MKPFRIPSDRVLSPRKWQYFDGCPVCRLFRYAAEKRKEISLAEIESAFSKAEMESAS